MEALGLNLGYLIVQILNFAVIFIVLRTWIYRPILGMLDKRRQTVSQGLEDARIASEARANAEQEANKIIAEAQKKAADIIRENTERSDSSIQQLKKEAESDIQKARVASQSEIEKERDRMLQELRGQVVTLAIAAAQKLIGESLLQDKNRQQALVQEFFSGIKDGKVIILEDGDIDKLSAEKVTVTSALPLDDAEQKLIQKDFISSAGEGKEKPNFVFNVDPSILGGLVIKVGDRIVDGSVSAQLEDLRTQL